MIFLYVPNTPLYKKFDFPFFMLFFMLSPGSPKNTHKINTGIQQGSPLSSPLFVTYVACLHLEIPIDKGFMLSYVDDFKIRIAGESYKDNMKVMKRAYQQVTSIAEEIGVSFSTEKTELIHWRTPKQREEDTREGLELDGVRVHPEKDKQRWLGYWWTPNMNPAKHFTKRLSITQGAFERIQRPSGFGKGLTPYQCRRLAKAILLPTMLYGAEVFQPQATILSKMETMWRRVQRWITNCFRVTEIKALSAEACLMPIELYIMQTQALATIRWATSNPRNNYTTALLLYGYPIR